MNTSDNRITLVVLTYNRREEVLKTLERLSRLPENPRIVLVANGCSDGTAASIAKRFPHVKIVVSPRNQGAAGRNLGVAEVTTPYVAFNDDDTIWEPGALKAAADILDNYREVAVISAHVLVGEEGRDDPACRVMAVSPLDAGVAPGKAILGFMAGASIMRVSAFRETGGYIPEYFIGGEEAPLALDLAARGWLLLYCPQVRTRHFPSPNRDASQRSWLVIRNEMWTAWMRLSYSAALRQTWLVVRHMRRQGGLLKTCWRSLPCLLWLISQRKVVPKHVEQMWRHVHGLSKPAHLYSEKASER